MADIGYIKEDFVTTYSKADSKSNKSLGLAFGDKVEILEEKNGWTKLRALDNYDTGIRYVKGKLGLQAKGILKISMIDVQQGDGLILETPKGKIMFVDGGDNQLFARHAAARYQYKNTSAANPMVVDAILVTHGDADHFDGLNEVRKSETNKTKRKQLFIKPKKIFHNGLVKSPSRINNKRVPDAKLFGSTVTKGDDLYVTSLHEDIRKVNDSKLNTPFTRWKESVEHWENHPGDVIEMKRIAFGMDEKTLFDFFNSEKIQIGYSGVTDPPIPEY